MAKPKIVFIINPVAGVTEKEPLVDAIRKQSEALGFEYRIYKTTGRNDREEILRILDEYKPEVMASAGGDGTNNLIGSILAGKGVKMGIIPLGSANGLALELNIPQEHNEAIRVIAAGIPRPLDAILINDDKYIFHLGDTGINARIIKRFEKEGKRGFLGYARQFFKEIRTARKFRCRISCRHKDKEEAHKARMVVIANGTRYGTGAVVNPEGQSGDGLFEVILIRPYPRWFIFRLIFSFFTGTLHRQRYIETFQCKEAEIGVTPAQEFQVDGETAGKTSLIRAVVVPQAIEVMVP